MTASKIEWCDRSDWNPIRGCTRVSPGCGGPGPNGGCYAEAIAALFSDPGQPFHGYAERTASGPRWTGKVELQEDRLDLPLRWRKPARIFVSSTSDVFHKRLPDEAIDRIFAVMALAPHHTFLLLTKRAERMREYMSTYRVDEINSQASMLMHGAATPEATWPLPNVWSGISAEDQPRADERIPELIATHAAVRFVSFEPLLGPVDITRYLEDDHYHCGEGNGIDPSPTHRCRSPIDWVITGGESGPRARPMHPNWARCLRDQCKTNGIAYFHKQNGEWLDADNALEPGESSIGMRVTHIEGLPMIRVGKARARRLLDGREWNEFPETKPSSQSIPAC